MSVKGLKGRITFLHSKWVQSEMGHQCLEDSVIYKGRHFHNLHYHPPPPALEPGVPIPKASRLNLPKAAQRYQRRGLRPLTLQASKL